MTGTVSSTAARSRQSSLFGQRDDLAGPETCATRRAKQHIGERVLLHEDGSCRKHAKNAAKGIGESISCTAACRFGTQDVRRPRDAEPGQKNHQQYGRDPAAEPGTTGAERLLKAMGDRQPQSHGERDRIARDASTAASPPMNNGTTASASHGPVLAPAGIEHAENAPSAPSASAYGPASARVCRTSGHALLTCITAAGARHDDGAELRNEGRERGNRLE